MTRGRHRISRYRRFKARLRAWWEQGTATSDGPWFSYTIPPDAFHPR